MKDKDKNRKLDYFSENLAVPEIHVNHDKIGENDEVQGENGGDMVFENLAIPEIKLRSPKKDKK